MKERQTPWEETPEEVRQRVEAAKSTRMGWTGTILGLVLAFLALVGLSIVRLPKTW